MCSLCGTVCGCACVLCCYISCCLCPLLVCCSFILLVLSYIVIVIFWHYCFLMLSLLFFLSFCCWSCALVFVCWFGGSSLSAFHFQYKVVDKLDDLTHRVDGLSGALGPDDAGGAPRPFAKAKAKELSLQERSLLGKRKRMERRQQVPKKKQNFFMFFRSLSSQKLVSEKLKRLFLKQACFSQFFIFLLFSSKSYASKKQSFLPQEHCFYLFLLFPLF